MGRAEVMATPAEKEKKARKTPAWLKGIVLPLVIAVIWQITSTAGLVAPNVLPGPIQICLLYTSPSPRD